MYVIGNKIEHLVTRDLESSASAKSREMLEITLSGIYSMNSACEAVTLSKF